MAIIINREGNRRFRCSDALDGNCQWEALGQDEDEVLASIENHWRERHNLRAMTEVERNRIRAAIRGDTAA
ncbi:MAG: DUF1059 domain-containing protein [Terriglobales bacterium]